MILREGLSLLGVVSSLVGKEVFEGERWIKLVPVEAGLG